MPSIQHPQNEKDDIATNQKALKLLAGWPLCGQLR
jgi:hypothetical protein